MKPTARSLPVAFSLVFLLGATPCGLAGDGAGKGAVKKAGGNPGSAAKPGTPKPGAALPAFVTFTQEEWGEGPGAVPKVTKLLETRFAEIFPDGLPIGSGDKKGKLFTFKSGEQVRKVLPLRGTAAALTLESREGVEDAGSLAGEMIAARLNQRFNRHGMLGDSPMEKKKDVELRDLQFEDGVAKPLIGKTVQQVFQWADAALGGEYGSPDPKVDSVDVTGDGKPDVSFSDLRRALKVVNENFPHGERDEGRLALPGTVRPPSELDDPDWKQKLKDIFAKRDKDQDDVDAKHDIEIDKARVEARKAGKPEDFDKKRLALEDQFAKERAEAQARFEEQRKEIRAKWLEKHPGSPGNGPPIAPGNGKKVDGGN